ncbi:hypothetical protein [Saccharopolyspora hattusasensis]|uniref:hypothetical protein n=1 Tax=Saccharopolyspora hattusasensis TaxID=1128679 RepID=UPI003D97C72E
MISDASRNCGRAILLPSAESTGHHQRPEKAGPPVVKTTLPQHDWSWLGEMAVPKES